MDIMLRGEIEHKIFESLIKHPKENEDKIKELVYTIFDDFNKKYNSSKYKKVENPEEVIEKVKNDFERTFKSYYKTTFTAKSNIEKQFKNANPRAQIS
ncbi:hypothetical protein [Clostridium sp.]|uniref:hypothetical protein n=1 Tax=Clostridium sp. TaxID=1506 RepID=UPI002FC73133